MAILRLVGTINEISTNVQFTIAGVTYEAKQNGDGTWILPRGTINPPLANGTYDVVVTATNLTGNVAKDSTTNELMVDATKAIWYVKPDGGSSASCANWSNACDLRTALQQAYEGSEIWVAAGVHYPGDATNPQATFLLRDTIALYGGFAGNETKREERNWEKNPTVLSGDLDRNDTTDESGVVVNTNGINGTNAYHVVTGKDVDASTILDGFVITSGATHFYTFEELLYADNNYDGRGGGMHNWSSNPTIMNVTFSGNIAAVGGGCTIYQAIQLSLTSPSVATLLISVEGEYSMKIATPLSPTSSSVATLLKMGEGCSITKATQPSPTSPSVVTMRVTRGGDEK